MPDPSSHLFEVEMTIDRYRASTVDVHMAAWRTGRYMMLDFSGGVQQFSAVNERQQPLKFKKTDKDTWRIEKGSASSVIIRYKVYANEFNLRTRELNAEHAFVDPLTVFLYVDDLKNNPLRLTVKPFGNWKVTTGLEEVPGERFTFMAPNFEYFGDCPLEIGTQQDFEFFVDGKKHIISIYGEGNWNIDTLIADFTRIIIVNKELWGDLPYEKYVFQIHCQPNAGGGTEHINSTIMGVRPFIFTNAKAYKGFLGLVSHEFFHTWNVKQLRPKGISPYDFSRENYTEELWVSEGTTSYYDDLMLVRAGFSDASSYLDIITQMVNNERSRYGNTVQPLAESSFDAWVKFWRGRQNAQNAESDYYGKGSHVSLMLDLEIRHRTNGERSLDDVLRTMYRRFPRTKGFTNADLQKVCEETGGGSFAEFFADYIYSTVPIPWEKVLAYAGLTVVSKDTVKKVGLGITTADVGEKTRITNVLPGSPGARAGLDINDEILALNGFRVRSAELTERISSLTPGDEAVIAVFRNDKLVTVPVRAEFFPSPNFVVKKSATPTEVQRAIYLDWLKEPFSKK